MTNPQPFSPDVLSTELKVGGTTYRVNLPKITSSSGRKLPCSLQILAENVSRRAPDCLESFRAWLIGGGRTDAEIDFHPARVLMHDTTCVPALVDIAALRDAVVEHGGDASLVNPQIP